MSDFPITIAATGATPQSPADLRAQLVALATGYSPGLTANLPGSLIDDVASTATGALVLENQAFVDLVNSITPYGANIPLLLELGTLLGVQKNTASNTSVNVVFSGPPGFVVGKGFTVGDGAHQYVVQDGGIIGAGGTSPALFAVATVSGVWAVPANTVNELKTSVPSGITPAITVTNPNTGTPSLGTDETWEAYRARVIQANQAAAQGFPTYVKSLLSKVTGVQSRLIAVQQSTSPAGWKVIVGGGDPYQVAYAIYQALFDISTLVGSGTPARNVSVTINDYPDTYVVEFVQPPQQTVTMSVTWNTSSTNIISNAAVAQLAAPALAAYVNSIQATQPMNLFVLNDIFQDAVASILPKSLLTRLVFSVAINGVVTAPAAGTGTIAGDSESYFFAVDSGISIAQG